MDTATRPRSHGQALRWATVERRVVKRHQRLDRAAPRGAPTPVRRRHTRLGRARAATLRAVRQVTQDNRGPWTAGGDGPTALTPAGRLALGEERNRDGQAQPVRRVRLPHPRGTAPRPWGLPTSADWATPRVGTRAREPAGEATCAPNRAGGRPGRRTWEALGALEVELTQPPTGVLEADRAPGVARLEPAAW